MKKLALLLPALMLTGCLTTPPVIPKFPDIPKELLVACPDLKTIDPANDKLSTVIETVTDNYAQYYDCKSKVDDWATWYKGQQKIWDSIK
jgi:hypothetical protein